MKKIIAIFLLILMLISSVTTLTSCGNNDNDCYICGGSGYYQRKDCPGC